MPVLEDLPHIRRAARGPAAGTVVLLHGPGASEQDPAGLIDILDPEGRLVAACPRGTMKAAGGGFQWYIDREPGFPQRDSFEDTLLVLEQWLELLARASGVPPERTLIGGFSQGAVVAWALAMKKGRPRAGGVLSMSGFVPRVSDLELDAEALRDVPVAITHGIDDPRIPVDFARSARERAEGAGAKVLYRETDVPHTLDLRVVPELAAWVGSLFR